MPSYDAKLSVIVPIYNVEPYIAECLDSLMAQRLEHIEVILVDDGSTDRSGEIARAYAKSQSNFSYHFKENGGQGQARNFGVKFATGKYLAFCDPDDLVPEYAYKHLYELAEETACDIAVGTAVQFNSEGQMPSVLHKRAFSHAPAVFDVRSWPQVLYDNIVCDKIIRRDFYEMHGVQFPVGMAYEDVATVVPMLCEASKIAYLDEVVYKWRKRSGEVLSVTQSRVRPGNLEDRLRAIEIINEYFQRCVTDKQIEHAKDLKILDFDLILFINSLQDADEERRVEMMELIAGEAQRYDKSCFEEMDTLKRIKYYYLFNRDYANLAKAISFGNDDYASMAVQADEPGVLRGQFPFEGLPLEYADVTRTWAEKRCATRIQAVSFDKDACAIKGFAYIRGYDMEPSHAYALSVRLVDIGDERNSVELAVSTSIVSNSAVSGKGAGKYLCRFLATIPMDELRTLESGTYRLVLQLTYDGLAYKPVFVGHPMEGRVARPYAYRDGERFFAVRYRAYRDFSLVLTDITMPRIKAIDSDGGSLVLTDSKGATHRVPEESIDFKARRIGDPARVPFCYFARVPLLAAFHDGVIRLGRSTQGSPVVTMLQDTKFVRHAEIGDETLTVRAGEFDGHMAGGVWKLNLVDKSTGEVVQSIDSVADKADDACVRIALGCRVLSSLPVGTFSLELAESTSGCAEELRCLPKDMKQKTTLRLEFPPRAATLKLSSTRPALVVEEMEVD